MGYSRQRKKASCHRLQGRGGELTSRRGSGWLGGEIRPRCSGFAEAGHSLERERASARLCSGMNDGECGEGREGRGHTRLETIDTTSEAAILSGQGLVRWGVAGVLRVADHRAVARIGGIRGRTRGVGQHARVGEGHVVRLLMLWSEVLLRWEGLREGVKLRLVSSGSGRVSCVGCGEDAGCPVRLVVGDVGSVARGEHLLLFRDSWRCRSGGDSFG